MEIIPVTKTTVFVTGMGYQELKSSELAISLSQKYVTKLICNNTYFISFLIQ
jgi:hypothetical protein